MSFPKWGLFYDFHTMPACPDVGAAFDCEAAAAQLARCGVDFTVFHARCNEGMAYYNTKVGTRHPALKFDLLKGFAEACHRHGIRISAYVNVGLSHYEELQHRDWMVVFPDGGNFRPERLNSFASMMCYNTGYADHVVAMLEELTAYPVDGFFLDCFSLHPCDCPVCKAERERLGLDRDAHAMLSRNRLMKRISRLLLERNPNYLLYFNGIPFNIQRPYATYFELECLPTGGWGYEFQALFSRHLRTLGLPALNMSGRFHESWGDFGGIRTRASLLYDCVAAIAQGLNVTVGDHFHPRGDLNMDVYDLIASIYGELQALNPWLEGATAVCEAALVVPDDTFSYAQHAMAESVPLAEGFCRMLAERKWLFDVLTPEQDLTPYRILFLADDIRLTPALAERLRAFLAQGGKIVSSGASGLEAGGDSFALPEAWPVEADGWREGEPAFFKKADDAAADVPAMPVVTWRETLRLRPRQDAKTAAETILPYYTRGVRDEYAFLYLPPDRPDGTCALALNSQVAQFSFMAGRLYHESAQVPVRNLVDWAARQLLPERLLEVEGLPSFARVSVTRQPGRLIVWLTAFVPERRGRRIEMIEEGITLRDVKLSLAAADVARVYSAPSRTPLPFVKTDGRTVATLPEMTGYAAVVFETTAD